MSANIYDEDTAAVIASALRAAGERPLIVAPTTDAVAAVGRVGRRAETPAGVRLLAHEERLRETRRDFFLSTRIADVITDHTDDVRELPASHGDTLVVGPEGAYALATGGDAAAGLAATDDGGAARLYREYDDLFDDADAMGLRVPGRAALLDSAAETLGEDLAADLRDAAAAADDGAGGDLTDGVSLLVLVGAIHGRQFYTLGAWAEDADVASKATVSRAKQRLEDAGLVETEKVPADVGRPRQRLRLADESLADADGQALYEAVAAIDD